jgi:phosphatidylglycerophosphatase A
MNEPAPVVRPSARTVFSSPVHLVAFAFGAGLAPVAPGTFGTLVGVLLCWPLLHLSVSAYIGVIVCLFAIGCVVCGSSAQRLGVHDYGGIVFDEVVGYLITALPLLPAAGLVHDAKLTGLIVAFLLFRVFDIWKPWPIRLLDRQVHGGVGIMLDDAVAGLFAALVLAVLGASPRSFALP